jgi:hypothetical protein
VISAMETTTTMKDEVQRSTTLKHENETSSASTHAEGAVTGGSRPAGDEDTQMVALADITDDDRAQLRAEMSQEAIEEYAALMKEGVPFPPVRLYRAEDDILRIGDGFHRVAGARQAGREQILAEVWAGSIRDAIEHAALANAGHGIRRTNADKRKAVTAFLSGEHWCTWSSRQIARATGVSHTFVEGVRGELAASGNDCQIDPAPPTRTATRNGKSYDLDTTNIGKRKSKAEDAEETAPVAMKLDVEENTVAVPAPTAPAVNRDPMSAEPRDRPTAAPTANPAMGTEGPQETTDRMLTGDVDHDVAIVLEMYAGEQLRAFMESLHTATLLAQPTMPPEGSQELSWLDSDDEPFDPFYEPPTDRQKVAQASA